MQPAYNVLSRGIDSQVGFVNGIELVNAVSNNIATIFDENIRLYEYGSGINNGINKTATSSDQSDMFYFYNNGVVFICDKVKTSPASSQVEMEGASVVNGCQTLNVLYNAAQKNKLNADVFVLVRIISISDYSERSRITEYLNSQTPIRDSYFIANHSVIRDLQKELISKGYFLERQINEYKYLKEHNIQLTDLTVLQLEKVIQYYVGYWNNKYASLAKRGKGALFDKNRIDELLLYITADKVIESVKAYKAISEVLTMYRKTRRNYNKTEFSTYMKMEHSELIAHIDEFRFMNTGDIIIMNAYANLKHQYDELGTKDITSKDIIVEAIQIVKKIIIEYDPNGNVSLLTKNASVFSLVQKKVQLLKQ